MSTLCCRACSGSWPLQWFKPPPPSSPLLRPHTHFLCQATKWIWIGVDQTRQSCQSQSLRALVATSISHTPPQHCAWTTGAFGEISNWWCWIGRREVESCVAKWSRSLSCWYSCHECRTICRGWTRLSPAESHRQCSGSLIFGAHQILEPHGWTCGA